MRRAKHFVLIFTSLAVLLSVSSCGKAKVIENKENLKRDVGLYPAAVSYVGDKKMGYIDDKGNFIIKPIFSQAEEFQANGLAVAGTNNKVGVIDKSGKYVIKPVYSYVGSFSDGRAIAIDGKGYKAIDERGRVIFETPGFIADFKDGRAVFYTQASSNQLLYGYIDTIGNVVIEPQFEYANDFENGLAVVRLVGGGYGLINKEGKILNKFDYYYLGNIRDGLMAFQEKQDSKMGYINEKGSVVIEPKYYQARDFEDGMAIVNETDNPVINKYGLIDKKGRYIIKPEYNDIIILGEGMLAVGKAINSNYPYFGSIYAVANTEGKVISDFVYYGIDNYKNGVASAYNNTNTFFIDKTGKRVENLPSVKGIGSMSILNNIIKVNVDRRLYYINKEGSKIVYKPSSCAKLKIGVTVCEVKYRPNRNYLVYYPELKGLSSIDVQNSINAKLKNMSIDPNIKPTAELDYTYDGDFSVGYNQKDLLVLELTAYNFPLGAAHGMPTMKYVHINIKTGTFYELKDLFKAGSNYVKVLSDIVGKQIEEHGEEMGVWPDSYKGIKPNQPFFITKGNLNLYFEPYEIAPYAAGFPTFTIPFKEINSIINKKGSFWRSFN